LPNEKQIKFKEFFYLCSRYNNKKVSRTIMGSKKTIREQSIEELVQSLLLLNNAKLSKLEQTILTEVLINGKHFKDLSRPLHLTTYRQKQIFNNATNRLMKALAVADESEDANAYSAMKTELEATKNKLEVLEKSIKEQKWFSPEMKKILSIRIDTSALSARVKAICYHNKIHQVSDLIKYSRRDFAGLVGCGIKNITEVEVFLEAHELSWR
jgi:predicted O-linked N-acetylglucosamine transferase (SPINDLY family)